MQYRILATDLDNTLIPFGEPDPRPEMLAAIQKMRAAGVPLVVATGRTFSSMAGKLAGWVPFDYAVCCNGGQVTDREGRTLAETPLTAEEMYALVDFFEDYDYPLAFAFRDSYYAYTEYPALLRVFDALPGAKLSILDGEDQDRHLIDMPHAGFGMLPPGALERFEEKYGYLGIRFLQVGGHHKGGPAGWLHYDIVGRGVDKAEGLRRLCGVLEIPVSTLVTAGDGENDVGMLAAAGLGCAMSNGVAAAKAAADRVIGDVRENGLAVLIEELWFGGPRAAPSASGLPPTATI